MKNISVDLMLLYRLQHSIYDMPLEKVRIDEEGHRGHPLRHGFCYKKQELRSENEWVDTAMMSNKKKYSKVVITT